MSRVLDDRYKDGRQAVQRAVGHAERLLAEGEPIGNPYYDLWQSTSGQTPDEYGLASGITEATAIRGPGSEVFAWAVPSDEALDAIADASPRGVVEIGAGTGYWARLLLDRGVIVHAYDLHPFGCECGDEAWCSGPARKATTWASVAKGGPEAAALHPEATLLLCWPVYGGTMATRAARAHHAAGGRTLAYVGEGSGGCTADDDFHRLIGEDVWCTECDHVGWCDRTDCYDEDAHRHSPARCKPAPLYETSRHVPIPQWAGLHDLLHICQRLG